MSLDRNEIPIKICPDCKKDSNEVDFHMKKTGKPCYYSKRCIKCQNLYRCSLRTRELDSTVCIDCGLSSLEVVFDYFKSLGTKMFYSRCSMCVEKLQKKLGEKYIAERFCLRCKESSETKEFRSKYYSNVCKSYYVNHCLECEKFVEYEKFCKKYNLEEIQCKFCNCSSLTNYFSHYKLRDKVILYDYCFECTSKNTKPEPKLCNKCGKSSNDVEFSVRQVLKKNDYEVIYDNICKKCMTVQRKKAYNTLEKKLKAFKKGAIDRNLIWELTDEQAIELFQKDCYYCGQESIINENLSGIDRVNNRKGYTLENCVSCCSMCNDMKRAYTQEDFLQKCYDIVSKHYGKVPVAGIEPATPSE